MASYYSDVLVDVLRALDIEYTSLNPGASFRGLHDSIVNYGENRNPELILCCDEEFAVDIASGYARVTGRPMAAIVHDIVGLMHATMGIFNAWVDRTPVIVLGGAGPMDVEKRRHWIDWIHTSPYQGRLVSDYVKWDEQANSLTSAVDSLLRGYRVASTSPKGPVYLSFDAGCLEDKVESPPLPDVARYRPPEPVSVDLQILKPVADLLVNAQRPVVLADFLGREGGATEDLIELAELMSLPVIDCGNMSSFPNTHPLDLTGSEKELLSEADVVLGLNVFDLAQAMAAHSTEPGASPLCKKGKIIDISLRHFATRAWVQDFGKLAPVDISISADPHPAISTLLGLCRQLIAENPGKTQLYQERYGRLKARHDELRQGWQEQAERDKDKKPISVSRVFNELWSVIKDEDWVLTHQDKNSWARRLWEWRQPYQYVGSRMGAGVGKGLGTSVGAALANRSRKRLCVDFQADGDLLFHASGLWTAAHHRIPLLIVMNNNRSYYNSETHQRVVARDRHRPIEKTSIGIHLEDPYIDYATLARSFGVQAEGPIEAPEDLLPAFERAVKYLKEKQMPILLDVVTQPR